MKKSKEITRMLLVLIALFMFAGEGNAQEQSKEEKLVRLAYMKLMFFSKSADAVGAADKLLAYAPNESLVFEIGDVHTGPVNEIYDKPLRDFVTKPTGEVIRIIRETYSQDGLRDHVMYHADWEHAPYMPEDWNSLSVAEIFSRDSILYADVGKYTSYTVTVRLKGKKRTYRAMVLYHEPLQSTEKSQTEFFDTIVGASALADALTEKRPPVRSPWQNYANNQMYLKSLAGQSGASVDVSVEDPDQQQSSNPREGLSSSRPYNRFVGGRYEEEGKVQTASLCPPGTLIDDGYPGMCCDSLTMSCCFPYDPNTGWCDAITCEYPNCYRPPPPPPPPPAPCVDRELHFDPVEESSPNFTTDHINGYHAAWAKMRASCIYKRSDCSVTCKVKPWGDPDSGLNHGGSFGYIYTFHVPKMEVASNPGQGTQGGDRITITCGRAVGIVWKGCFTPSCGVNISVSWNGNGFTLSSNDAMDSWLFGPTNQCNSIAPPQ